jgi:hypothetical protein
LRALGGLYAGAFTTTQRNAIPAGQTPQQRPYGLVILNTTTNQYEWNRGTDTTPDWQPLGINSGVGNLALRPAANAVSAGSQFFAVDQMANYISDGTNWIRTSAPAGSTIAWFAAAAPAGYVKYDGSVLPASTGIYADLATHLGSTTTPDTRGRVIVGQGTHADNDAIGDNDGRAVALRRAMHTHTTTVPTSGGGAGSSGSLADTGTYTSSVDGPANITGVYIAKL